MKATIIETKKQFEPIEIKLVIESEEELCDLWHRLNISPSYIMSADGYDMELLKHGVTGGISSFWVAINKFVRENNLAS